MQCLSYMELCLKAVYPWFLLLFFEGYFCFLAEHLPLLRGMCPAWIGTFMVVYPLVSNCLLSEYERLKTDLNKGKVKINLLILGSFKIYQIGFPFHPYLESIAIYYLFKAFV